VNCFSEKRTHDGGDEHIDIVRDAFRRKRMKKSKKQIDEELDEFYSGDSVNFVEIRFTDKMILVGFPFKDINGFYSCGFPLGRRSPPSASGGTSPTCSRASPPPSPSP
jgi:hypothetical protein